MDYIWNHRFSLCFFLPTLFPSWDFFKNWLWFICLFCFWCVGLCVYAVRVLPVLCDWRLQSSVVVFPLSCCSWRALPGHVAVCLVPMTAPLCGGAAVSPTSPLLMGIWAISSPLLLLVLQWIIMYIYHPMFLPLWYPWGLIFMRVTDGLKSNCICNFGGYCQIPPAPPPFSGLSCLCSQQ